MKRLKDEEVTKLILEIKSGDKTNIPLLIENYRGYVLSVAYRRARVVERPVDELISAGFYGVCRAVDNINNFSEGNFLAFISPYVNGEIEEEIASNIFGPKPSYNRVRKHRNQEQIYHKRIPMGRDGEPLRPGDLFHRIEHDETIRLKGNRQNSRYKTKLTELDIKELIDEITQNDREKQIIELRLQGMTDREIAIELRCSHTTVFLTRKTISERLNNGLL